MAVAERDETKGKKKKKKKKKKKVTRHSYNAALKGLWQKKALQIP
ncbi:hypothetical protein SDJN02_22410, partial [Cucurbita argyrosperma subsp. argyrosperma]